MILLETKDALKLCSVTLLVNSSLINGTRSRVTYIYDGEGQQHSLPNAVDYGWIRLVQVGEHSHTDGLGFFGQ